MYFGDVGVGVHSVGMEGCSIVYMMKQDEMKIDQAFDFVGLVK
jgi:hypothetical protein